MISIYGGKCSKELKRYQEKIATFIKRILLPLTVFKNGQIRTKSQYNEDLFEVITTPDRL
jgi:hypothetical protein